MVERMLSTNFQIRLFIGSYLATRMRGEIITAIIQRQRKV